jgi:hypothetical protein
MTNAEAQAKLATQIGTQTENIYVQNTTQLTEIVINVGDADNIRDIVIKNNNALQTLNINGNNSKCNQIILETKNTQINLNGFIELNEFIYKSYNYVSNTIIINDLTTINKYAYINSFGSLKFPNLKYVIKNDQWVENVNVQQDFGLHIYGNFVLFEMPLLEEVETISLGLTNAVVTFPSLQKVRIIHPNFLGFSYLETLNLPALTEIRDYLWVNTTLTNINLYMPSLVYCKRIKIGDSTSLSINKVNAILHQFLNIHPNQGKIIDLQWQNPSAPPTGQGLIDKQSLIAQGNTVRTD